MEGSLFKELYLYELSRKEELTGRVTVLLTAVTVIGALGGYLLKSDQTSKDLWSFIISILLVPAAGFYGRSIYYLNRLYSGYEYAAMPTPASLQNYYGELVTFYRDNPEAEGDIDSTFTAYLDKKYAKATEINAANNESKAVYHAGSIQSLVLTLLFLTLAGIVYLLKRAFVLS